MVEGYRFEHTCLTWFLLSFEIFKNNVNNQHQQYLFCNCLQIYLLFLLLPIACSGQQPTDPSIGFLPPNPVNGTDGQGFVTYTVKVEDGAPDLEIIDAEASIIFDNNEPIDTPAIFNTVCYWNDSQKGIGLEWEERSREGNGREGRTRKGKWERRDTVNFQALPCTIKIPTQGGNL